MCTCNMACDIERVDDTDELCLSGWAQITLFTTNPVRPYVIELILLFTPKTRDLASESVCRRGYLLALDPLSDDKILRIGASLCERPKRA